MKLVITVSLQLASYVAIVGAIPLCNSYSLDSQEQQRLTILEKK